VKVRNGIGRAVVALLVLAAFALVLCACGGGGSPSTSTPPLNLSGTPAGTYTIVITAKSGSTNRLRT
jgi:hypothetical protein